MDLWWILWVFIAFLPIEVIAALTKKDTLSETVWDWFGIRTHKKWGNGRRLVLAGFMLNLTLHFVLDTSVVGVILFGVPVGFIMLYSFFFERKPKEVYVRPQGKWWAVSKENYGDPF